MVSTLRRALPRGGAMALAAVVTVVATVVIVRAVDAEQVADAFGRARGEPARVGLALAAFAGAFVLRAVAWRRLVRGLTLAHSLSAIHLALGANHVLPLRLGEPLRVVSVVRRTAVPVEAATASTITLRSADMVTVVVVGLAASPAVFTDLVGPVGWAAVAAVVLVAAYGWWWMRRLAAGATSVRRPGPVTYGLTAAGWLAESVVVWQAARWAGIDLAWNDALLVTTVAVAAQIAAVAPGGLGTYEAAAVAAYVALGHDADAALVAALAAHGLKTAYSLVTAAVSLAVPAPTVVGRLRLGRSARDRAATGGPSGLGAGGGGDRGATVTVPVDPTGPIVLFMPALDEEATVAACVGRTPPEVLGRRVEVVVVDDGSTDATAARARAAGAEVISLGANRGLGAAVRAGLQEAVDRGAAVVAFCDADGEYPPEELANLVGPILAGESDYVVGSRFLGRIDHMRLHRRLGNVVLTWLLSIIARRRITDGQTGYRAFSPAAAADAEVIHDFNYAQVLTLDLLAKGYRYREVPISYHFRTEGESFVKLGRYLRNVAPAVYRELNAG